MGEHPQPDTGLEGTVRNEWDALHPVVYATTCLHHIYTAQRKRMRYTRPVQHFMAAFMCIFLHSLRSLWQLLHRHIAGDFLGAEKTTWNPQHAPTFFRFCGVPRRYGRIKGLRLGSTHFSPLPLLGVFGRGIQRRKCLKAKRRPVVLPYLLRTS